jgi:hypothetical protein
MTQNVAESNFYRVDSSIRRKSTQSDDRKLDKSKIVNLMARQKKNINANVSGTKFEIGKSLIN